MYATDRSIGRSSPPCRGGSRDLAGGRSSSRLRRSCAGIGSYPSESGDAGDANAVRVVRHFPARSSSSSATLYGQPLDLAPKEFEFLAYLARHVGKVCTRRMILETVWGPAYSKELHYLKVYAYRLRRKLKDEKGEILQSDPSVGYRLVRPGE